MREKQFNGWLAVICRGALLVSLTALGAGADAGLKVRIITGILIGTYEDGVRTFKNIPFAAPPVGDRRWATPQPPPPWNGERAADKFGPSCTQLDISRMSEARKVLPAGVWIGAPLV